MPDEFRSDWNVTTAEELECNCVEEEGGASVILCIDCVGAASFVVTGVEDVETGIADFTAVEVAGGAGTVVALSRDDGAGAADDGDGAGALDGACDNRMLLNA